MSGAARYPDGTELRMAVEMRAAGKRLEGTAVVYNVAAQLPGFEETIAPGVFRETLQSGADILALCDHDNSRLLGRTKSGTLRLRDDAVGLHFQLDLPETSLGRDILALAERRDLGGMSFSFRMREEAWSSDGKRRRVIRADLYEISCVAAHPAYPSTIVSARARGFAAPASALRRRRLETL
jgi:HK97 family phage prohead protease